MRASPVRHVSAHPLRALSSGVSIALLAGALGVSPIAGCTQPVDVAPPRAFNRPARIALVCFSVGADGTNVPTALDDCYRTPDTDSTDGVYPAGVRLIALVPQQTRGEVGAVELSPTLEDGQVRPPRVLDSDQRVPGYTFVETGEVPTAIAVSETSATCTWVANRGSRDIWGIETIRFLDESLSSGDGVVSRLALDELEGSPGVTVAGRPQEMLLHETGTTSDLYVTLPEDGMIARIPVSDVGGCTFGTPVLIPVPTTVPDAPTAPAEGVIPEPTLAPVAAQDLATLGTCPNDETTLELVAPVPGFVEVEPLAADLPAPVPLEMVFERDDTNTPVRLFIGDAALPVIHRFDLATGAFEEGLRTDGPISDLTLTVAVPDTTEEGAPTRSYAYAIDGRDGSVMVVDVSTGFVIPVQPAVSGRPLRLPFRAPARAIEAIDNLTRVDPEDGVVPIGGICDGEAGAPELVARPDVLRGVFVSVALSDGTVRIVDVFDLDARCRFGAGCQDRFVGAENLAFLRRHRPRIGERLAEEILLADLPTAVSSGATLRFDATGTVEGEPLIPSFTPISCPDGLAPIFPVDATSPFLCAITDPWSSTPEVFAVTWEGAIPETSSAAGNVVEVGGELAIDARIELCSAGVLEGDLLAITPGVLPDPLELPAGSTATAARCRALAGSDTGVEVEPFLIEIAAVSAGEFSGATPPFESRILLGAGIVENRLAPEDPARLTLRDIVDCYGETQVSFEVRVNDEFAVVGSSSGFLHRVVADPAAGGSCTVDAAQDPLLQGRAQIGVPFASRRLAFTLQLGVPIADLSDLSIAFRIEDSASQLRSDLGVASGGNRFLTLPTELLWNQATNSLYALDELRRGLAVIPVEPFAAVRFIE